MTSSINNKMRKLSNGDENEFEIYFTQNDLKNNNFDMLEKGTISNHITSTNKTLLFYNKNNSWLENDPNFLKSRSQMNAYNKYNKLLISKIKFRKQALDHKYDVYNKRLNTIQLSIITMTILSAVIQGSGNMFYISHKTSILIGIMVSTYTSFILSVSKYRKYDKRKEKIHSLREQFASFYNKIQIRDDIINSWSDENLWVGDVKNTYREWIKITNKLKNDSSSIIEQKQHLFGEFEKIMDTKTQELLKQKYKIKEQNEFEMIEKEINKPESNMVNRMIKSKSLQNFKQNKLY